MIPAAFGYRTRNLGDDMQTIAAALQLGGVHRLIDRDALADEILDAPHAAIFNSWFLKGEDFRLPPPLLTPIFHGLAIGKDAWLTHDWLALLRQHQPIGCRDAESAALLEARGVRADFSGCLTLSIGCFFTPIPDSEREDMLLIDISPAAEHYIPAAMRENAVRLTMVPPTDIERDRIARLRHTAHIIERLRRAKRVITRRLHAALPAVGCGTPTIVLPDPAISNARRRFSGYMDWLPGAFIDDAGALRAIDWHAPAPGIPAQFADALARLQQRVRALGFTPTQLDADPSARWIDALFATALDAESRARRRR